MLTIKMPTVGVPVYGELEEELQKMIINPAKHSTKEYYEKWRGESYPLNLESDKRGRAIIFTMTERRPGWDEDVKSLYRMFKSINVDVERVYDPDYTEIVDCLKAFVENPENISIDMCFVIFMGHGYATTNNLHDVNLKITGGSFDIWPESVNIFRKETSLLRKKPKVFIVQSCRSVVDRRPDLGVISLGRPASFADYKYVFASQPGMVANRKNHFFIDTLTTLIEKEAHSQNLCYLTNRMLIKEFSKWEKHPWVNGQMPQICETLSNDLNIFPGITKYSIETERPTLKTPQQESETSNKDHSHFSTLTNTEETSDFDKKPRTQPTGTPEESRSNDLPSSFQQSQRGQTFRSSNESTSEEDINQNTNGETSGGETDNAGNFTNASGCQASLQIEARVQPNTDICVQKTEEALVTSVNEEKQTIQELLSSECESPVTINDTTLGCILIHITCDLKALEALQFLSETGLLSSKFSSLLVTKSLIENCNINHVTLNVKLKIADQRVLRAMKPMVYCLPITLTFLRKAFTVKSPIQTSGEGQWFHDGRPIKSDVRINIYKDDDNMCVLKVKEACESDTGDYSFKCTSTDGFPIEVKGSVFVMNQSAPSNVKAEATETEIKVTWDAAIGNIKSYYVEYLHEPDVVVPESLVVSNRTKAAIPNLLPGETYKVYVRSVSEDGVSDPEPPEGLTVHTQPETPVGHLMKESVSSGMCRVSWEKLSKKTVFVVITMTNLKESVNADNTYVVPSDQNRFEIHLMDEHKYDSNTTHGYKRGKHSCSLSFFYKGKMSTKINLDKNIEFLYKRKPEFLTKSTNEYYDETKDSSYPLNMGTLKRGRAIVFVTEGQRMDFQMDLLKLFASLSIQYWIIHDPDVETIDWYLKEMVQKKKSDNVNYCLVFFIGKRLGTGIDTKFVTKDRKYFNIFKKCRNIFGQRDETCPMKIPMFCVVNATLSSETEPLSDVTNVLPNTECQHFEYHFVYTNFKSSFDKLNFLKLWVNSMIAKCDHLPLEDIAEYVVQMTGSDSSKNDNRPQIEKQLSKKFNLFPGLIDCMLDQTEHAVSARVVPSKEATTSQVTTSSTFLKSSLERMSRWLEVTPKKMVITPHSVARQPSFMVRERSVSLRKSHAIYRRLPSDPFASDFEDSSKESHLSSTSDITDDEEAVVSDLIPSDLEETLVRKGIKRSFRKLHWRTKESPF